LSSGNPAALLQTVPWMEGPHAAAITTSLDGAGARHRQRCGVVVSTGVTDSHEWR